MDKEVTAEAEDEVVSDDVETIEALEAEVEEIEADTDQDYEQEEPELADESEADDGSIVVTLEDEEGEDEGSQPLREIRKQNRELNKKLRALEAAQQSQTVTDAGKEPELEDYEYDTAKFKAAYAEWVGKKAQADQQAQKQREQQEAAQQRSDRITKDLVEKQQAYVTRAKTAGFKDFDEAQASFEDTLPEVVRSTITDNASSPEIIVMALHQNPELAEKFKAADDVRGAIKAAWELSKLESKLRTAKPKSKPAPDSSVKGGARLPRTTDKQLEKLEQEAARTGDRTKVLAYKRQLKSKEK